MNDPFEPLRDLKVDSRGNPVKIRKRAEQIVSRRRAMSALSTLALVGVGVVVLVSRLPSTSPSPAAPFGVAGSDKAADPEPNFELILPLDGSDKGQASGGTLESSPPAAKSSAKGFAVRVASAHPPKSGEEIRLQVEVCNPTQAPLTATFNTGQRHELIVRRDGKTLWKFSADRAFTQAISKQTWSAGQCTSFDATWSGLGADGKPVTGEVEVVGMLTTDPPIAGTPQKIRLS